MERLRPAQSNWPGDIAAVRLWYEPHLERSGPHADAQVRRADLLQLEQIAAGFPSRERFLTELTLDPPNATSDQADAPLLDEDYLVLSTIHSAKGQEWRSVYVLNVVDGCIPSDMATSHRGGDRGGATTALCRHDPGQGRASPDCAAALLYASAGVAWAIATSMRPGRASFRTQSSTASKHAAGRWRRLAMTGWAWARQCPSISGPACAACGAKSAALGLLLLNRLSGRGVPSGLSGYAAARFSTRRARSDAPIGMIVSSKSYPAL